MTPASSFYLDKYAFHTLDFIVEKYCTMSGLKSEFKTELNDYMYRFILLFVRIYQ